MLELGSYDDTPERRRRLVYSLCDRVKGAKAFHEKAYKQMREDMLAAGRGHNAKDWSEDFYTANILQRHVQQRTAALYAKNPKAVAERRDRMEYSVWDGNESSLANAYALVESSEQAMLPPPPSAQEIVLDFLSGQNRRKRNENIGKTLELLMDYYMSEQIPGFKSGMKSLVRRVITTGVGYLKLGFQRDKDRGPEVSSRIADVQAQLDHLRRIAGEVESGELDKEDPQVEELMLSLRSLEAEPLVTVREGLIWDFPEVDSIIVDPMCRHLRGFQGAKWVAHEMYMSTTDVKEIFDKDISDNYHAYDIKGRRSDSAGGLRTQPHSVDSKLEARESLCCVYEVYDRPSGMMYCIADGYQDFLMEPKRPPVQVETFWPIFSLQFNEMESRDDLYPPSDIKLLMPMQNEYNRARQGLREHRRANRPKYAAPAGLLEPEDKAKLTEHPANAVIELQALASGQRVQDVIQPVSQIGIDPNLYEVSSLFDDVQLVVGQQEANFGQLSKATATETSIAESSRMSALGAAVDELDGFLSDVVRAAGQVLLFEMSTDQVRRIVGPGAVWPEGASQLDVMEELYLKVEAGSTGKPNRAEELRNIERIMPFLLQIPGIDPKYLARELLRRLDDRMDLSDALASQMPSIAAMNRVQGAIEGLGSPDNPLNQGMAGAQNLPAISGAGGSLPPMGPVN